VPLIAVTRDRTLRGEMKSYVKDMSGHKFAESGGDILQIYVFMTDCLLLTLMSVNFLTSFFGDW
jgi:hypothetical protein